MLRQIERERATEGCVVPSRVKLREGPINVTELHWAKPTMIDHAAVCLL
jgi:hypothetical protein